VDLCSAVTCGEGERCAADTGACVPTQCSACETDAECGAGAYCLRYNSGAGPFACGLECSFQNPCADGLSCVQVRRNGQQVGVCADQQTQCAPQPCDGVVCAAGEVCDPASGACVVPAGAERAVSVWSANSAPFCRDQSSCTADERCEQTLFGSFCTLTCGATLECPADFTCCNVQGLGERCVSDSFSFFGAICQ
jgi:hypothetical protein